jgi:bifunctional NMN adenylyltransferase/nudix hydrolase
MKTVIIGRFQPLHNGHLALFEKAFGLGGEVIVVIGSAHQARTPKNPFSAAERETMLRAAFPGHPLQFVHQRDYHDDGAWNEALRRSIGTDARLIAFEKDDSSYYLNNFPKWERIPVVAQNTLSATEIRDLLFLDGPAKWLLIENRVPPIVLDYLKAWEITVEYRQVKAEFGYYRDYAKEWGPGPHVTVDAVVINNGHVLLVRRKNLPGQGLLALPGGFANNNERLLDAALRELREETGLNVSRPYLESFLSEQRVRDYPGRSLRGRVISHVFCFRFDTREPMPVHGDDDAAEALWMPIEDLPTQEAMFFEDHYLVLADLLKGIQ